MPASVLTMPEATRAAQMHQAGHSELQIAAALGRSRKAVRTGLRQIGVQPRTKGEGYRAWLALRGGKGPHDGGSGVFHRGHDPRRWVLPSMKRTEIHP